MVVVVVVVVLVVVVWVVVVVVVVVVREGERNMEGETRATVVNCHVAQLLPFGAVSMWYWWL